MAIYMKFGDIKGSVTTEGFKDWIEIDSFDWGVTRHIGSAARGAHLRESSEPEISEIAITKRMDASSPKLVEDALAGKMDTKVTITLTTTAKGDVVDFLSYELSDTGISDYKVHSGGADPTESFLLNFTKIIGTFKSMDPNITGTPEKFGYDLTKMKLV